MVEKIREDENNLDIKMYFYILKGVSTVDPNDYLKRYGSEIKNSSELPSIVNQIKTPEGLRLANEIKDGSSLTELEGDLQALSIIIWKYKIW